MLRKQKRHFLRWRLCNDWSLTASIAKSIDLFLPAIRSALRVVVTHLLRWHLIGLQTLTIGLCTNPQWSIAVDRIADPLLIDQACAELQAVYPNQGDEAVAPSQAITFLTQFLQSKGYYHAKVVWKEDPNPHQFFVELGVQTRVTSVMIEVTGALSQEPEYQHYVSALRSAVVGSSLNHAAYLHAKQSLEKIGKNLGYAKFSWDSARLIVDIVKNESRWEWKAHGGPQYHLGSFSYLDSPLSEGQLEKVACLSVGDKYHDEKLTQLSQTLLETGWFRDLQIQTQFREEQGSDQGLVHVTVRPILKKLCNVSFQLSRGLSTPWGGDVGIKFPCLTPWGCQLLLRGEVTRPSLSGASEFGFWDSFRASGQLKFPTPFAPSLPYNGLSGHFSQEIIKYGGSQQWGLKQSHCALEISLLIPYGYSPHFKLHGLCTIARYAFEPAAQYSQMFTERSLGLAWHAEVGKNWTLSGQGRQEICESPRFGRLQFLVNGLIPLNFYQTLWECSIHYQQLFIGDKPLSDFPFDLRVFGGGKSGCRSYSAKSLPIALSPSEVGASLGICWCNTWSIPIAKTKGKAGWLVAGDLGCFHTHRNSKNLTDKARNRFYWSIGGGFQISISVYPINLLLMFPGETSSWWPGLLIVGGRKLS